jgi:hypothetical protein
VRVAEAQARDASARASAAEARRKSAQDTADAAETKRAEAEQRAVRAESDRDEARTLQAATQQAREASDRQARQALTERDDAVARANQAEKERDDARRRMAQAQDAKDEALQRARQAARDKADADARAGQAERDAGVQERAMNRVREMIKSYQGMVVFTNQAPMGVAYKLRWQLYTGQWTDWSPNRLEPTSGYRHWCPGAARCEIEFDYTARDGTTYDAKNYWLEFATIPVNKEAEEHLAKKFRFVYDKDKKEIDVVRP